MVANLSPFSDTAKDLILLSDIPLDRISDLAVNIEDVSINGKPFSLITEDDLSSTEPVQIRLTVYTYQKRKT